MALLLVIALVAVLVVAIYLFGAGNVSAVPAYSAVSTSSTRAGSSCRFSVTWNDDMNVSGYIFGSNNTGSFVNETWVPFSVFSNSTSALASVTKILNSTVGNTVAWMMWSNDSGNNWGMTGLQSVFVDSNKVLLVTTMGNITIQMYDDMPITTGNFKNLTRLGVYDGTIFHRVIDGFMIQGGDPTGTGVGDPNIAAIPDEFTEHNRNNRGTIAMANTGEANTGSSQFFINLVDNNYLDDKHPVFGQVIDGMDVVDAIGKVETDSSDKPLQDVSITRAMLVN